MKHALAGLFCVFLLAGCASPAPIVMGCPVVHAWTKTDQSKMLNELNTLPEPSVVWAAFKDYARMRAEARACSQKP